MFAKYGIQRKTEKEWFKVFRGQLADILLYIEAKDQGKVIRGDFFRQQVIQLAAACEDALENEFAW